MSYKTVKKAHEFRIVEKKSEFIGYCAPVKSEDEAVAFVNSIKKKHSDARHNVYAYVLREGFKERFSDDGEPHGTAGMPVLDSIRKLGLTDTAVVVTRYFGGILLGTGGLVRAYTSAASGVLKEAGVNEVGEYTVVSVHANYSDYQKIIPLASFFGARTEESVFSTDIDMVFTVKKEKSELFIREIIDATNGRARAESVGERIDFV